MDESEAERHTPRGSRSDWERKDNGDVRCGAFASASRCIESASTWMRCPAAGIESPVCSSDRKRYQRGAGVVDCLACGERGVYIREHYEFWPLDSEEPGARAPQT